MEASLPDYYEKRDKTYIMPVKNATQIVLGYSLPQEETQNVEKALSLIGKTILKKFHDDEVVTFIFDL